jgi:hypothetical protein
MASKAPSPRRGTPASRSSRSRIVALRWVPSRSPSREKRNALRADQNHGSPEVEMEQADRETDRQLVAADRDGESEQNDAVPSPS